MQYFRNYQQYTLTHSPFQMFGPAKSLVINNISLSISICKFNAGMRKNCFAKTTDKSLNALYNPSI